MNNVNNSQLNSILSALGSKLGTDPNQLKNNVEKGNIQDIMNKLPQKEANMINNVLSDPNALKQILNSKEARSLMEKLGGGK